MVELYGAESLVIIVNDEQHRLAGVRLANRLGIEGLCGLDPKSLDTQLAAFALVFDHLGVSLQQTGRKAPGPIRVDFVSGAASHRRRFGGGKGQMIAKAVGLKAGIYPRVLDLTAGLGQDAFVLASLRCRLTLVERSPLVQALLADGLARAEAYGRQEDAELLAIVERMTLHCADSIEYLDTLSDDSVAEVIYLDPMFPERSKAADVKKAMKAFHTLVGGDLDADQLLEKSLERARYRVVVKRPRKAPCLGGRTPSYQLPGKSSRFDIYTLRKLPDKLHAAEE